MSLRLVNRNGLLALPLIFILNICVTITAVLLVQINEIAAGVLLWMYTFYLLLQTRLMILFLLVGTFGGLVISGYTADISQGMVLYAMAVLLVSSVVAHGIAFIFTFTTGI